MSTNTKTAFVLVPGSFSTPIAYDDVVSVLTSPPHSYPSSVIHSISLPSTNSDRSEGPATLQDDAAHVAHAIEDFADQGYDVVMAMNSYAGFVGSEAGKNLSKASRAKAGKQGGLIALVYIAAFLPTMGQTVKAITGGVPGEEPYMTTSAMRSPEMAQGIFVDQTPDEALRLFDLLTSHSRASFDSALTYEAYKDKDIKVFYLHVKRDYVLKSEWQLDWLEKAKESGAEIEVVVLDYGHVPMIGREKEVADLLVKAAAAGT